MRTATETSTPDWPRAVHQAGHAIMATILGVPHGALDLGSDIDLGPARAHVANADDGEVMLERTEQLAYVLMAGSVAEMLFFIPGSGNFGKDFDEALTLLQGGLADLDVSSLGLAVMKPLSLNHKAMEVVARALVSRRRLDAADVTAVLQAAKIKVVP